jgi:hypothetical protein
LIEINLISIRVLSEFKGKCPNLPSEVSVGDLGDPGLVGEFISVTG